MRDMKKVNITTTNGYSKTFSVKNTVKESEFWKRVGKCLTEIEFPTKFEVEYEGDWASFEVSKRGTYIKDGIRKPSMYVKEIFNNIFLDFEPYEEKYLTCINTESNNYKFYHLRPNNNREVIDATYGRIGSERGEAFGVKDLQEPYPSYMFWIRYFEKLSKGYKDQSDIYLQQDNDSDEKVEEITSPEAEDLNTVSVELYEVLLKAAHRIVEQNLTSTIVTQKQVEEVRKLINTLGEQKDINSFNNVLQKILVLSPRRERYISFLLAKRLEDFSKIILREDNLCTAMEALVHKKPISQISTKDKFKNMGIEVYEATEKQKEQVMKHLGDGLDAKVIKIYRVINRKHQKRFDSYLKRKNIKKVHQFWHGSINENWLSIIENGLQLNPNAKITGKMFGYGIYFAPRARKSFGYTSCQGSYWARGNSTHGYMGLYATAYGKPDYVNNAGHYTQSYLDNKGCNCVFAKAENTGLRNDEIIFYSEEAVCLNYIVEFSA